MPTPITLRHRPLLAVLLGITGVLVLLNAVQVYLRVVQGHDHMMGFALLFELDRERNVPTLVASLLHLTAAGLLVVAGIHAERERLPHRRFWFLLGAAFVYLAVDESVGLHERSMTPLRETFGFSGVLHQAWVVPGFLLVALLGVASLGFLRALPRRTAAAFVLAGAIFVGGALGVEMVGGAYLSAHELDYAASQRDLVYLAITAAEETLELVGISVFIAAIVRHLGGLTLAPGPAPVPAPAPPATLAPALPPAGRFRPGAARVRQRGA